MARSVAGDGEVVIRAVGRVRVDNDGRAPLVEEAHQGAHLRRFQLDVVAIEVEPLGVGADANFGGTVLVGTVGLRHAVAAIVGINAHVRLANGWGRV